MFWVIVPILHNSHKRSRFCTESCVLFAVRQGHTLDSVTANADTDAIALDLGHSKPCKAASVQPVLRFPQRNWPNLIGECSILQAGNGSAKKIPDIVVCC
jgi:hypothetical protein